jgi:hypothetical protein
VEKIELRCPFCGGHARFVWEANGSTVMRSYVGDPPPIEPGDYRIYRCDECSRRFTRRHMRLAPFTPSGSA